MGNFIALLLGIPTAALVLAYMVICASMLSAKRRMAGQDARGRQAAGITGFHSNTRNTIGHAQVMAPRAGN
jgi:hypothetical protein